MKTPLGAKEPGFWAKGVEQACYQTLRPVQVRLPVCFVRLAGRASLASADHVHLPVSNISQSSYGAVLIRRLCPQKSVENDESGMFSWSIFGKVRASLADWSGCICSPRFKP